MITLSVIAIVGLWVTGGAWREWLNYRERRETRAALTGQDSALAASLSVLLAKWRKDAEQYRTQVAEATAKGVECRFTDGTAGALQACATELEKVVSQG